MPVSNNDGNWTNDPTLTWNYTDSENNPQLKYRVLLSNDDFTTTIDSGIITSSLTRDTPQDLVDSANPYIWRISVFDGFDWSGWQTAEAGFKLDTIPPEVLITYPEDNFITNQPQLTVTYTSDGIQKSKDVTLIEGSNTLTITETDPAGNSSSASIEIILDTEAPFVDIDSPENPYITETTYALSGNKSDDVSVVTLGVTPETVSIGPKTYSSTTWQCQLSNLTEGAINLILYCQDSAGNSSPVFSGSLIVDTMAPSAPTLAAMQLPALTNKPALTLEGTKEVNSSVWLDSAELGLLELLPVDSYQLWNSQVTLQEGENHIRLFSKDYAGNQSAFLDLPPITLDTQAPGAPVLNEVISPANNPKCLFSGTKEANSSIWINNQEFVPISAFTSWSCLFKLAEGINDIIVFSKDGAGNSSPSVTRTVLFDITAPPPPVIAPVLTPCDSSTQILQGSKTADTAVIFIECPTADVSALTYPADDNWSCTLTNLTAGKNRILAISCDEPGNQSEPVEAVIDYAPLKNLSAASGDELNPDVAVSGDEIFTVWQDVSNSDVYLKYSPDGGTTYRDTGSAIGQGYLPKLAADSSGNIYAVLGGGDTQIEPLGNGGGIYLIKSTDKGLTFGEPVNIGIGFNPAVTVSKDGSRVYVCWYRKETDNSFTVRCRSSSDGADTFLPAVQVNDIDSIEINPRFGLDTAVTADGKYVYSSFSRKYEKFYKIAFSKSADYGVSFQADYQINPQPHNGYNPQVACFDSSVYCLWQHDALGHNHIWITASCDNGQNFSDAVRVDDGDHDTTEYKMPAIAVDEKGIIYTAFVDTTNNTDDIYTDTSFDCVGSFQDDTAIDAAPEATSQKMPAISVNSTGGLLSVAWQDGRNGDKDIYIRNFKTITVIDWLKSRIGSFGFLDSFQDDGKNVANTYDQALAVIAFTKAGEFQLAKKILDALQARQNADGSWYSRYNPDTGENTDFAYSKYTGNISWVIIAANFYTQTTKDISYLAMAQAAAEYLWQFFDNDPESPTYGSLTGGMLDGIPIAWRSTEHNLDVYSAFEHLQRLLDENEITGSRNYSALADLIRAYLMNNMWNGMRFLTGWQDNSRYLDVNPLAVLSLGIRPDNIDIRPALEWAFDNLSLQIDWDETIKGVSGFDEMVLPGQLPNKIWCEGAEQMSCAYNIAGKTSLSSRFHKQIQRLQQADLSIPYSTLGSTEWPRHNSVSSTCWFYFNQRPCPVNPMNPESLNTAVMTVDDFGDALPHQNSLGFYTDDDDSCLTSEDTAGTHHIAWNSSGSYWYSVLYGGSTSETDASLYEYLSFRIKSSYAGTAFIVRLEDAQNNRIDVNIKDYAGLKQQWQRLNIPAADFTAGGLDVSSLKSIIFIFNEDSSGEIWFDDLGFTGKLLAPFARITAQDKIYCRIPAEFSSSGSGDYDGGIVWYQWDFGDGGISAEPEPFHTYLVPGDYILTLKIKDNDGITAIAQKDIIVYEAPLIIGDLSFISDADNDLIYQDDIIVISATNIAVEGQDLQHKWTIDGEVAQDYSPVAFYQWDTSGLSIGRHFVEYDVKDEYGNTAHRQVYVYVYRRPVSSPDIS